MPVTTMFYSDSTDKDRTPYKSHPDQHGHWDVQDIAALLHERDALQARYDALEKSRGEFIKRSADYAAELAVLKAAADHLADAVMEVQALAFNDYLQPFVDQYRAATGKGQL